MTREEAIQVLTDIKRIRSDEIAKAIDMAIEALSENSFLKDMIKFYRNEDRPQGEWTSECACSLCGCQPWYERDIHTLNYCPNCGARMEATK